MIDWIKKDLLVHLTFLTSSAIFIVILVFIGLLIYEFIQIFDPNYVEFGPNIGLYKSKDCVKLDKPYFNETESCFVFATSLGVYRNNMPILSEGLKKVVSGVSERFDLNSNPTNIAQWECETEGKNVNLQEKMQLGKSYKCWLK